MPRSLQEQEYEVQEIDSQLPGYSWGTKKLTGEDSRCIFLFLDARNLSRITRKSDTVQGSSKPARENCQVFVDYPAARDGSS